jgi:putative transposase
VARANRHFVPGQVWHLTHRCHKREFLLKFVKDRHRWLQWLYKAKKQYGLVVLNYVVTSNHIHLVVYGKDSSEIIPKSVQLLAGRTGQEYNQRKNRKGAFWEDRYHATAIETGEHLLRCIVYIDLNMVRAGVVEHPKDWPHGGYIEIQRPRRKNIIIDNGALAHLCGYNDLEDFQSAHRGWIETALSGDQIKRDESWTQSIAIGNRSYVESIKRRLGGNAIGRKIRELSGGFELREAEPVYNAYFGGKNDDIHAENYFFWND